MRNSKRNRTISSENNDTNEKNPKKFYKNTKKSADLSLSITEFEYFQYNLDKTASNSKLQSTLNDMDWDEEVNAEEGKDDIQDIIQSLEGKEKPTVEDAVTGIIKVLKCLSEFKTINQQISSLNRKTSENSTNIKTVHENVNHNHVLILKNIESVNFLKQQQVDNNVMMSGFPKLPDEKFVKKSFCKIYSVPENAIESTKTFETNNSNPKASKALMFFTFRNKQDQINLMKKKQEIGEVNLSQFTQNSTNEDKKKILKVSRCLSLENRQVISQLRHLIDIKSILTIRYRNCCFQMQIEEDGKFIPVPSIEHLKQYFSLVSKEKLLVGREN